LPPASWCVGLLCVFTLSTITGLQTSQRIRWWECLSQPAQWYSSKEAIRVADNLLLYQCPSGGWPKNIDMAAELSEAQVRHIASQRNTDSATIDNRATYTQMRFLAKVYTATGIKPFEQSFTRGFDYLIASQYSNGGWPQFFPLQKGYYSHITFNDDAMVGVMTLLKDITVKKPDFKFVDVGRRGSAARSIQKGLDCILKCQIKVNGVHTAWCAQHDEHDFSPAKARTYELPSLSGAESVGVVEYLMGINNPTKESEVAVQSAIAWFDKVKIRGIRVVVTEDTLGPARNNRITVNDPSAPPMWARFYEIGTNKPFFCSRDGIKHDSLSQISYERRNHYVWLGYWPKDLLNKKYPQWIKKHNLNNVLE
jgi:PelA/Pel-15E family pectate lyase